MASPSSPSPSLPEVISAPRTPSDTVPLWMVIQRVTKLHVLVFQEQHRWRNTAAVEAPYRDPTVRGALVYYCMSGWMLRTTTSCHPGWQRAVRRAHAIIAVVTHAMVTERMRVLIDEEEPGFTLPTGHAADREKQLLECLHLLIGVGVQLHESGPEVFNGGYWADLGGPSEECPEAHPHRDTIITELGQFVEAMDPYSEAAEVALFDISCVLARHRRERFYTSVVAELCRSLEDLRDSLWAMRLGRANYLNGPQISSRWAMTLSSMDYWKAFVSNALAEHHRAIERLLL